MKNRILSVLISLLFLALLTKVHPSERELLPTSRSMNPEQVITNVGDFTIVDTDGITRNLYQSLDEGNTILIFILSTT